MSEAPELSRLPLPEGAVPATPAVRAADVAFLRTAAAWVLVAAAVALLVVSLAMPDHALRLTGFALAAVIAAWSLWAVNRGRSRQAAQVMVYGAWAATCVSAVVNGGLASPAIVVPPVTVLMAGWLLGMRSAIGLAAASAIVFVLMALGARAGLLLPPPPPPTGWLLLVHGLVLAVATALAATLSRGFAARLAETQRLARSLEARLAEIASRDRALAEQHLLHQALLEAQAEAGVGLFIIEDGRISFANAAAGRIYGLDEAAMRAVPDFLEFVHPDDRERVLANHRRRLAGDAFPNRYDIAIVTAAGERRDAEITVSRMQRGERVAVLVVMVDVSERKRAEQALRVSEERFRSMAEQSADWVWAIGLDQRLTYTNGRVAASLGYEDQAFLRMDPRELVHPEDLARFEGVWREAVGGRRGWRNVVLRWRHAGGGWRVLESSATPTFDAAGALTGFQGVDRDITERDQAERELAESRARFRDLVNTTDGIVWEADAQTFTFTFVSDKAERLLGFPVADWYRPGFWVEHLHADDRQWATELCMSCTARLEPHQFEYRFVARDGRVVWLHDIVTVVPEAGRPRLLRGLMVDITDRKEIEAALRESEERFRGLVESSSDWIWEVDRDGRYTYASPGVTRLLGYRPDEVLGRRPFEFMPPEEAARVRSSFLSLVAEARPIVLLENVNLHRDGHRVVLETSGVPILGGDGMLLGYRGVDRDITERKAVESRLRQLNDELGDRVAERTAELEQTMRELEQAMRELEAFNYSASHDLRTPLRGIEGFSTLLLMDYGDTLDAQGRDYLVRIRKGAQRLSHLIDDMLDLSRLNRRELAKSDVDLSAVAASVMEELRSREPLPHTTVRIAPGLRGRCDAALMRSVLTNLIGNAWKYTRSQAAPHIEFDATREDGETVFHVRDNGVGFDMAHSDKLFQPFQRLHGPGEFEGSGIGLASVARIVERHGGRVWAESAPGAGATFHFTLGG